jgi:hypothetical protein
MEHCGWQHFSSVDHTKGKCPTKKVKGKNYTSASYSRWRVSGSSNSKFSSISIPGIASGWTGELPVRPEDVESSQITWRPNNTIRRRRINWQTLETDKQSPVVSSTVWNTAVDSIFLPSTTPKENVQPKRSKAKTTHRLLTADDVDFTVFLCGFYMKIYGAFFKGKNFCQQKVLKISTTFW